MKTLITLFALLLSCGSAFSQTQEEMAAWEASMTPGAQHEWLASMDGYWNAKVKLWMDPSQPASESEATSKNEMIMNGLYQRSSHTGNMMGMPFSGESTTGYDNVNKKFVSSWIDNMGSGIMTMEGSYEDQTKTLTFIGKMTDPTTGTLMDFKETLKVISPDSHVLTMYMVQGDADIKTMEIIYTRAKD